MYLSKVTDSSWSKPRVLAPTARGHQLFPDINADGGYLFALWHDSRNDSAYSVQNPPGNDGGDAGCTGLRRCRQLGLDTYGASSVDGGAAVGRRRLSSSGPQMPNYEMFGDRRVPFHGDYNYVS